jgi:hypothetical protein
MKQAIFALALAGLAGLAANSASAQHAAPAAPAAPGANVLAGITCLNARSATSFAFLLSTPPYSAAERREATQLMPLMQRCTGDNSSLSTNATQLRGLAAEDLYERQFTAAQAPHNPPIPVAPLLRPSAARAPSEVTPLAPSYALGDCLTAAHPDQVRTYLAAPATGDAEQTAFRALTGGLAACIPAGAPRRIGVDGPTFRGILAEDLYRWSVVQRDGASSPFAAH